MRVHNPRFRTVSECAVCTALREGRPEALDHIQSQYAMLDPTKPPVPLDQETEAGILMLYPEEYLTSTGKIPMSGGVVGTVKSIFRALGLMPEPQTEVPQSKTVAKSKRRSGLFD